MKSLRLSDLAETAIRLPQGGKYIYCVADSPEEATLGKIGIGDNEAYSIAHRDLCAIVHDHRMPTAPVGKQRVLEMIIGHQRTIDAAWEKWRTVLPLTFGTVISASPSSDRGAVTGWLERDYLSLRQKMDELRGKAEYGVKVFWDSGAAAQALIEASLRKLEQEMCDKPKGLVYMYRQRLEHSVRQQMDTEAERVAQSIVERIRQCVDDIRFQNVASPASRERQMMVNLSCLAADGARLGEELDLINNTEGLSVHFTGPWPPYSFTD